MQFDQILQNVLTAISSIVLAVLAYVVGRRQKLDEIRIKKGYELAEEIVTLFQDIVQLEKELHIFFTSNFGHIQDFEIAVDHFEKLTALYQSERKKIADLGAKRAKLYDILKLARLYLSRTVLEQMTQYLDVGTFHYESDGGLFTDTYYEEFFRNIVNEANYSKRHNISKSVLGKLGKLHP